ncbi:hypothetical protein ACGRHY_29145 [Streptomyces sp. HK10]|uniref:hypothetical protein n=1 Tax=Streptomyces sp. HK10 TaxID=3373255 RepID=UPI003747F398
MHAADSKPFGPAELESIASEFGIREGMLNAAVEEDAHERAADRFNGGALAELDFWDAYDRLHDEADAQASRVNDSGVTAQLAFLAEDCTRNALRALLHDLITPA